MADNGEEESEIGKQLEELVKDPVIATFKMKAEKLIRESEAASKDMWEALLAYPVEGLKLSDTALIKDADGISSLLKAIASEATTQCAGIEGDADVWMDVVKTYLAMPEAVRSLWVGQLLRQQGEQIREKVTAFLKRCEASTETVEELARGWRDDAPSCAGELLDTSQ